MDPKVPQLQFNLIQQSWACEIVLGPPFVTGKPWSGLMVVLEIVKLWPSPSFSGRGLFHYIADDESEGHNSSYDDDGGGGGGGKFWEETLFVADGSNNLLLCAIKCKTLHKKITGLGGKKMLLSSAIVIIIEFKKQEIEKADGLRPYEDAKS